MYHLNLPFKMRRFFFVFIFFMVSCDVETPIKNNFVVEAFLFQGEKVDDIKIKETRLWNSEDTEDVYIEDASVILYGNGDEFDLEYSVSDESYTYKDNIDIVSGKTYGIEVVVNGRTATAQTIVPTKPLGLRMSANKIIVPPLKISRALPDILANLFENARTDVRWDNPNNENHYLTIKYVGEEEDPIFSDEIPGAVGDFFSNFSLQSEPTQGESYNVICMSLKNYGKYKVSLYKINDEYMNLFDSEVQDGTELNEPPSNIINAFGIFSAFASDTTSFEIVRK